MAEKFITQSMINGVCKHPELWPNIDTDLGSFIFNLPNVDGNTYKVGVKKEINYVNPGEQEYISNGDHTFTVPAGITKLSYGVAGKTGISLIDNTFKVGSTSVHFATSIYSNTVDTNNYSNYRMTAKGDLVVLYTPGTASGHNLKISRDKGNTWELQNCSYAPNGKIVIGGANNTEWVIASNSSNAVVTYSLDAGVTWQQSTIPTSNDPSTFVNINPLYHHESGIWYFSNYPANEFAKTTNFVNWTLWGQVFDDFIYGEDVTYTVCQFNQMFSKGTRIYIVVKTLVEINYNDVISIPVIRYTDDDFQSITVQVDPQFTRNPLVDKFNEYRYTWTDDDPSSNTIYFTDSIFKKIFKTTDGFQTSTMLYDGSTTLVNMNVVNSALNKDYLFIFNTNTYGNSKMYQLRRSDDTSTYTNPTGIGTITENTTIACCANENNESYLLSYKNTATTGIKISKARADSTDYTGTYINDNNSNSSDTWISNIPNGIKMIWKNNITVSPGQTFSVTLSGGDSSAIFRWGTGNNIVI